MKCHCGNAVVGERRGAKPAGNAEQNDGRNDSEVGVNVLKQLAQNGSETLPAGIKRITSGPGSQRDGARKRMPP